MLSIGLILKEDSIYARLMYTRHLKEHFRQYDYFILKSMKYLKRAAASVVVSVDLVIVFASTRQLGHDLLFD